MPGTTTLCIARHGETDWNVAQILQGWIDVPLNDTGRRQALEMADELAGFGFARICTSPLRRASDTADVIAQRLGVGPALRHEGLKERNFGTVQGRPKSELAATHPELLREILRRNPAAHFEQGESMDHFADRVIEALFELADEHVGHRVLVITHGWVMDAITRHVAGLPRDTVLDMKRRNGECLWLAVSEHASIREIDAP